MRRKRRKKGKGNSQCQNIKLSLNLQTRKQTSRVPLSTKGNLLLGEISFFIEHGIGVFSIRKTSPYYMIIYKT